MYEMIARSVIPGDHGPLSDDDLTDIAAQTFSLLDEEESRTPRGEVSATSPRAHDLVNGLKLFDA